MILHQSSNCCPSWPVEVAYKCSPMICHLWIIRICLFLMEVKKRNKLSKYVFTCYFFTVCLFKLSVSAFSLYFSAWMMFKSPIWLGWTSMAFRAAVVLDSCIIIPALWIHQALFCYVQYCTSAEFHLHEQWWQIPLWIQQCQKEGMNFKSCTR